MVRRRQPYTPCKLYIDGAEGISAGDYIVTSGGSAYLVQAARRSPTITARVYMDCLRWVADEIPDDARCFKLNWYRR